MCTEPQLVKGEAAMLALGADLAKQLHAGQLVFLLGDLGAGKTTLVRGILNGLGHSGAVKSPTYTLVEPYHLADMDVYHFDLYRMESAEELEAIGAREMFHSQSLCLIEWPHQSKGWLPEADIEVQIAHVGDARTIHIVGLEAKATYT